MLIVNSVLFLHLKWKEIREHFAVRHGLDFTNLKHPWCPHDLLSTAYFLVRVCTHDHCRVLKLFCLGLQSNRNVSHGALKRVTIWNHTRMRYGWQQTWRRRRIMTWTVNCELILKLVNGLRQYTHQNECMTEEMKWILKLNCGGMHLNVLLDKCSVPHKPVQLNLCSFLEYIIHLDKFPWSVDEQCS